MIHLLFVLMVVLGFAAMFVSTWPSSFPFLRFAWGCWLVAALIWALEQVSINAR